MPSAGRCEIKATVVAKDEREQNLRAILNFGHTFGHAIEASTGYDGLSARRSGGRGDADRREFVASPGADRRRHQADRLREILDKAGLPTEAPRVGAARDPGIDANGQEGARRSLRLVLLEKLGRAIVTGGLRSSRARCHAWRSTSDERPRPPMRPSRSIRAAAATPNPSPPIVRNINGTAIASSIRPRSAGSSTRPRCSSIMRAICTGPG